MIIAFDDDAVVYPPTLSIYGTTTWTWVFSEGFVAQKIIELVLALYSRALILASLKTTIPVAYPYLYPIVYAGTTFAEEITLKLNERSTTLAMKTKV